MVGAITALVGTEGHQVITAYDGLTAVRRYREERPDIVLLDLAMPGRTGSRSPARSAPRATRRSSSSRARAPRRPRSARSASAPTTTSSSRSGAPSCWRGSRRSCAARIASRAAVGRRRRGRERGTLRVGSLDLDPGRHEARVGEHPPRPDPDRVPPRRGARPRRRRPRPPPPPRPRRLAGRGRPGPALAEAPRRPPAPQGRGRRRPPDPRRPRRRLPPRGLTLRP